MNSNNRSKSQLTNFQRRVYEALLKIPRGRVTTYKILAKYLSATGRSACGGKCGSCRAVGQALKRNPFAPKVPCHRVIASDLTAGGFRGSRRGVPIKKKLELLKAEGIKFKDRKLADKNRIYRYPKAKV